MAYAYVMDPAGRKVVYVQCPIYVQFCQPWLVLCVCSLIHVHTKNWRHGKRVTTYLITYSMEQSPSWEANWFAASQEISHVLWNLKVHCHIHKFPPPFPILSQLNWVPAPTSHFLEIHLNIIPPSEGYHYQCNSLCHQYHSHCRGLHSKYCTV